MKLKTFLASVLMAGAMTTWAAAPKYIFYFIGDGMGMGQISCAQGYVRAVAGPDSLLTMMKFPVASYAFTQSASSPVTDSAAAGTALATGHKTNNGMLGVTPDTTSVQSIAVDLKKRGYGIGLVTTVAPDDATPAAFYTHVPSRSMFYEIGKDAAASGFEFIAGANLRGTKTNGKPNDLLKVFAENNVSVVRGLDGLKKANSKKVLLLNTDSVSMNELGMAIDSLDNVLTLPGMTRACLDHLMANSPKKFFMMVEGGSIDHAGHANDGAGNVIETVNFNNALAIAYEFYKKHPKETLILVTADHETGGMSLASPGLSYYARLELLQYVKMSKDRFGQAVRAMLKSRRAYTWADMKEFLSENLGLYSHIPVSERENARLMETFAKTFVLQNSDEEKTMYNNYNEFESAVFKVISNETGIGWTTSAHSGGVVPVYAIGDGAYKFAGAQDNTDLPKKIRELVGIK